MQLKFIFSCFFTYVLLAGSACDRKEGTDNSAPPRAASPAPQPIVNRDPRQSFEAFATRFCAAAKVGSQVDMRNNIDGIFRAKDKTFKSEDLDVTIRDYVPADIDVVKTDSLVHPYEGKFNVNFRMLVDIKKLDKKLDEGPIKHRFVFEQQDDRWLLKEYIGGNDTPITPTPEWVRAAQQAGNGQ